ncbi:MAG: hypothetical protein ACR2H4_07610 [Pyrinomonadaceae bacterium]
MSASLEFCHSAGGIAFADVCVSEILMQLIIRKPRSVVQPSDSMGGTEI